MVIGFVGSNKWIGSRSFSLKSKEDLVLLYEKRIICPNNIVKIDIFMYIFLELI